MTPGDLFEDMSFVLTGPPPPQEADFVFRTDGVPFFYEGKTHTILAEPESGKTWLVLWGAKIFMERGGHVVWLDYEMSAEDIGAWLLYLGAEPSMIVEQFHYANGLSAEEVGVVLESVSEQAAEGVPLLLAVDSWDEALHAFGVDPNHQEAGTVMASKVLRPMKRDGVTTVIIDHATTNVKNKKRGGAGSFRKLAAIEVAVELLVEDQPRPGGAGRLKMKVIKDRPGWLRRNSQKQRNPHSKKLEEFFGTLHIDSTGDPTKVSLWIDSGVSAPPSSGLETRPLVLHLMASGIRKKSDIQAALEKEQGNPGKNAAVNALQHLREQGDVLYNNSTKEWELTVKGQTNASSYTVSAADSATPSEEGLVSYE